MPTTTHIKSLLTGIGIDDAQADTLLAMDEEAAKSFKPDDIVKKVQDSIETKIKNSHEFWEGLDEKNINEGLKKKIEAQQYGRASNVVRKDVLKSFGLTEDEFKELGEEGKKIEVFLPHAAKLMANKSKVDETLQKQFIEAQKQNEKYAAELPELEKTYQQKYENEYKDKVVDTFVLAEVSKEQANITAPANYIYDKISAKLKQEYALVTTATGVELRQKANPSLKVLVDGSSKELSFSDAVKNILKSDNLYTEEKKPGGTPSTVTIIGENGLEKSKLSGHVSAKVAKQIEAEAKDQ